MGIAADIMLINVRDVREVERRVCRRLWETFREFQDSLNDPYDRGLIDHLEVLLRENMAYDSEESQKG